MSAAAGGGEGELVLVRVQFRGVAHEVSLRADASLASLGATLAASTGAAAASLRLLLPGRTVALGDDAAASRSLRDAGVPPAGGKRVLLLGALVAELAAEQAQPAVDAALRLAPPEHAAAVAARRRGRSTALVLPPGPYTFASFRALPPPPGAEFTPTSAAALRLLHRLACDPGIAAVMTQRRWRVGLMSEMPPEGKVGVSAVCVLGYNVNAGQEIALRLRTDDMRGFRSYERIRETLLHELAHMVYSEHDLRFKALNSELTVAAARADWTRGSARTLGGMAAWDADDEEDEYEAPQPPLSRPLGGAARLGLGAHQAAAAAAERRAAEAAAAKAEASMAAEAAAALERACVAEAEEAAEAEAEAAAEGIDAMDVTVPEEPQAAVIEAPPDPEPAARIPSPPPADLDAEMARLAAGAEAARARAAAAAAALAGGGSGAPPGGEATALALRTVASVLRNALAHPGAPRYRVLPRRGGGAFESRAGRFAAARELLSAAGFIEEAEPGRQGATRLRLARDDPGLLWLALDAVNDALARAQPQDVGGA